MYKAVSPDIFMTWPGTMKIQVLNKHISQIPGDSNTEPSCCEVKKLDVFLPLEEANQSMLNLELDK